MWRPERLSTYEGFTRAQTITLSLETRYVIHLLRHDREFRGRGRVRQAKRFLVYWRTHFLSLFICLFGASTTEWTISHVVATPDLKDEGSGSRISVFLILESWITSRGPHRHWNVERVLANKSLNQIGRSWKRGLHDRSLFLEAGHAGPWADISCSSDPKVQVLQDRSFH